MTHRDMGKATLFQSGNRDVTGSKCSIRVCTFMHFEVRGVEAEMQYTPTGEIGKYISRENNL